MTNNFYDKEESERWDKEFRETGHGAFWTSVRLKFLKKFIKNGKILEIGAGSGIIGESFSDVVFTDISKDMAKLALRNGKKMFVICNAEALPFRNSSFNHVVGIEVLEHCNSIENAVSECSRVMKSGGWFVFDNLNPSNPRNLLRFRKMADVYPDYKNLFAGKLQLMLKKAGFGKIVKKNMVFCPLNYYKKAHIVNRALESFPMLRRMGAVLFLAAKKGSLKAQ